MKAVVLFLIVMNDFDPTAIEQTQLLSYNPNTLFCIFLKKFKITCSLFSEIPQFHIQMHQFWCTKHKLPFSLTTSAEKHEKHAQVWNVITQQQAVCLGLIQGRSWTEKNIFKNQSSTQVQECKGSNARALKSLNL